MKVVGIDLYNQSLTGGVAKTLSNKATDADHIPCVLIYDARGNGGVAYAQQSREITKTE